uniref:Cd allosteric enzyme n=1 Tax=Pseudomonas phage Cygsa01 TaxID=3138529 RepID=A0AAU6W452_9VIRU
MSYKPKNMRAHMAAAWAYAMQSSAKRNKVGSVLIKNDSPIACGYNGTYPGDDNECEVDNVTKEDVVHAEINCLDKLRHIHETAAGATLVVTHEPCLRCAREIVKSRIESVVFELLYKSEKSPSTFDGLKYLTDKGVKVSKYCQKTVDGDVHRGVFLRIDENWVLRAKAGDVLDFPRHW